MDYVWIGLYLIGVVAVRLVWYFVMIYPDRTVYCERLQIKMYFDLQDRKRLHARLQREHKLMKQWKKRSG